MIAVSAKEVDDIIFSLNSEIMMHYKKSAANINTLKKSLTDPAEISYVTKIIDLKADLVTARLNKLLEYAKEFDLIIPALTMRKKPKKEFREKLIDAMGYPKLRSDFYAKYFSLIGIKSCVYCNAVMAVVVEREVDVSTGKKTLQAKFQVDHYLPKVEYPCLSISLYNLYPVCANCNNSKSSQKIAFNLYADLADSKSKFEFRLLDGSQAKFMLSHSLEDLQIKFNEPDAPIGHERLQDVFAIEGVYNTQKDIVAEIILKSATYSEAHKEALVNSLPKIFANPAVINRLLTGYYTEEKDIHKRALSKFTLDIAYQVGLLKRET